MDGWMMNGDGGHGDGSDDDGDEGDKMMKMNMMRTMMINPQVSSKMQCWTTRAQNFGAKTRL